MTKGSTRVNNSDTALQQFDYELGKVGVMPSVFQSPRKNENRSLISAADTCVRCTRVDNEKLDFSLYTLSFAVQRLEKCVLASPTHVIYSLCEASRSFVHLIAPFPSRYAKSKSSDTKKAKPANLYIYNEGRADTARHQVCVCLYSTVHRCC